MGYINHFGESPENYLQFRPDYPDALYDYLASICSRRELAWDCGTGNGQAAIKLSDYFQQVIATDINQAQLDVAKQKNNIQYQCAPAEKTLISSGSVDLITIAQALHWFSFTHFYEEVKRVSAPNGMIAAWTYTLGKITPSIDTVILKLYSDILGDQYWPNERKYVDEKYQTIPFPFQKMVTPTFAIEKEWKLEELMGYLMTWSAVKEYDQHHHQNPVALIEADLKHVWGDPSKTYKIHWPIHLLVAYVHH